MHGVGLRETSDDFRDDRLIFTESSHAPRYEDVWINRGMAPRIRNYGSRSGKRSAARSGDCVAG